MAGIRSAWGFANADYLAYGSKRRHVLSIFHMLGGGNICKRRPWVGSACGPDLGAAAPS